MRTHACIYNIYICIKSNGAMEQWHSGWAKNIDSPKVFTFMYFTSDL